MQLFHLTKFKEYKIQQFPQKFQRLIKSSRFLLSLQKIELVKKNPTVSLQHSAISE